VRVQARPSSPLPSRPAVSFAVTGTPVPPIAAYSLPGSGDGGNGTSVRAVIMAARSRTAAAAAVPLASAARPARLTVRRTPARFSSSRAAFANGPAAAARSFNARSPERHGRVLHAGFGIPGGQLVLAGDAVIPGTREGDRPGQRAGDLVPAGDEPCLMTLAARHPRAAVAAIGAQQPAQHAAARLQHPGADHGPGSLRPGAAAAQRPGRCRGQPSYLGGFLPRDRLPVPLFPPSGAKRGSVPAAGLASQIFSFTSAICSQIAANSACRPTSRRTLATSPAASCRPTVPRPRALRVHKNLGPCPR
jgi:hypothetical protein